MTAAPAKKKRTRNPQITRKKLLQAAVDLVAEKGSDALSLKEVAQRADVSRSVAYLHFEHRDHLLDEAKAWMSNVLQEGVERFDESVPLYERILHTTSLILGNPEVSRAMMVDALTQGDIDSRHPLYKQLAARLREQKKRGKFRPDTDIEVMACIHLGSIAAVLLLESQHRGGNADKLAKRFAREWSWVLQNKVY